MPSAEIITIGTEILLGEIIDTNAPYIARALRDAGVDLFHKTSVGDNPQRIAQAIKESLERCDIVITTGGLGPTVDDPTREAVALAVGVETEYRPELWDQIQARFRRYNRQPTENNRRQAFIPKGATAVENPVGTAPAFIVELGERAILSLPGVPREMEFLMMNAVIPYLRQRYHLRSVIISRLVHTASVGESQIDDLIGDLELLSNPTVGLAAHTGQVDIRITAKADSDSAAEGMIQQVEEQLRERLGDWIFGVDQETLERVALRALAERSWKLVVLEAGLGGELVRRLAPHDGLFLAGEVIPSLPSKEELRDLTASYRQTKSADVALGVALWPGTERQEILLVLLTPDGEEQIERPYGGAPANAYRFAVNQSLDLLRRLHVSK
jgi:competence/damage-inducible protein CinA-like protein